MPDHIIHAIEPVFDENSRVLVLGSIPSPKSREEGFFYGHPQNRFWRVLASVFDEPVPRTVSDKRDMLLRRHIALWDVVRSCDIEGASDASIKNAEPNDLARIFDTADIEAVFCTGAKAGALYARLCEQRFGKPCTVLPSTSPANAKETVASLSKAYAEALLEHLPLYEPPVLDVKEVVALEHTLEKSGTPLADLMQRAGRALAQETMQLVGQCGKEELEAKGIRNEYPNERFDRKSRPHDNASEPTADRHACCDDEGSKRSKRNNAPNTEDDVAQLNCVVLCGMGNNGGDGWVAASELVAAGCDVTVVSAVEPEDIKVQPARDAALHAAETLRKEPRARLFVDPNATQLESALEDACVIVDAILGTGFAGSNVRAPFDQWIQAANNRRASGSLIVAADVPSGLNAQTGKAAQPCIKADATVTMIAGKPGLFTPYAFAFCGNVRIAPIAYIETLLGPKADAHPERSDADSANAPVSMRAEKNAARTAQEQKPCEHGNITLDASGHARKGPRPEKTRALKTRENATLPNREFFRAEAEDDDGYDPYSDRRPEPEPFFERDPWS